jgi:hypothetical protein
MTTYVIDGITLDDDATYTHPAFRGVALRVWEPVYEEHEVWYDTGHIDPDSGEPFGWWQVEERQTGQVYVVMVGDDYKHIVDPHDLTVIGDDDYCSGCGQIGCQW